MLSSRSSSKSHVLDGPGEVMSEVLLMFLYGLASQGAPTKWFMETLRTRGRVWPPILTVLLSAAQRQTPKDWWYGQRRLSVMRMVFVLSLPPLKSSQPLTHV